MANNPLADDLNHILAKTAGLWDELRGKRLFITGGTGFFGCWLLESFAWANDHLDLDATAVVLSRNPQAFKKKAPHLYHHSAIEFIRGDVCNFEYPDGEYPFVIHAATDTDARLNREEPLQILDTIISGTRHTLDFASSHGTRKFLLISSGAVYGKQPSVISHVPEDYQGGPDTMKSGSTYGEGKRTAELLSSLYTERNNTKVKIARCFAFVGPYLRLDAHYAIGNFIRDGMAGQPISVNGDGTPLRSYLYAADMAIWLWTILFQGQFIRPYNVGSDISISIAEMAHLVAQRINPGLDIVIKGKPDPGRNPEQYVPCIDRARNELGLDVWVGLPDAIDRTRTWHENGTASDKQGN
jgi:nucleoside-diphosphate-sugar epimerase